MSAIVLTRGIHPTIMFELPRLPITRFDAGIANILTYRTMSFLKFGVSLASAEPRYLPEPDVLTYTWTKGDREDGSL